MPTDINELLGLNPDFRYVGGVQTVQVGGVIQGRDYSWLRWRNTTIDKTGTFSAGNNHHVVTFAVANDLVVPSPDGVSRPRLTVQANATTRKINPD